MSYEKNAVGIDVSNGRSTVSVLRPFGEVVVLPFNVQHTTEELSALADKLLSIDGETRVVMEHTGRYYESIEKLPQQRIIRQCGQSAAYQAVRQQLAAQRQDGQGGFYENCALCS